MALLPAGASRPVAIRLLAPTAVAVAAAGSLAVLAAVDPHEAGHFPGCPFLALTGWYCPGCGSLRMLHDLAQGRLREGIGHNPLAALALPYLVASWLAWTERTATGRPRRYGAPAWVLLGVLAVIVGYTVLRNLPAGAVLAP